MSAYVEACIETVVCELSRLGVDRRVFEFYSVEWADDSESYWFEVPNLVPRSPIADQLGMLLALGKELSKYEGTNTKREVRLTGDFTSAYERLIGSKLETSHRQRKAGQKSGQARSANLTWLELAVDKMRQEGGDQNLAKRISRLDDCPYKDHHSVRSALSKLRKRT